MTKKPKLYKKAKKASSTNGTVLMSIFFFVRIEFISPGFWSENKFDVAISLPTGIDRMEASFKIPGQGYYSVLLFEPSFCPPLYAQVLFSQSIF